MGEDKLSKFIKDKVQGHETPMDIDDFWQGIQDQQEEKEEPKRRVFWWFFFGGLFLIGTLLAGVVLYNGVENQDESPIQNTKQKEAMTIADEKIDSMKEAEITAPATQEKNAEILSNLTPESPDNQAVASSENNTQLKGENNAINAVSEAKINLPHTAKIIEKSESKPKINTLNSKLANANNQSRALIIEDTLQSDSSKRALSLDLENQWKQLNKNDASLVDKTTEKVATSAANQSDNLTMPPLPKRWSVLRLKDLKIKSQNQILPDSSVLYTPDDSSKKLAAWSIGVHFCYGFSRRTLNGTSDYVNTRNQLETPEQVISAGLDLQYQFKSGLYLKSGLNYEQINERFDLNRTTEFEDFFNEDATNVIYRRSNGTTDIELGTTSTQRKIQLRKVYNRYRMIDLPLIVGYTSNTEKKWNWFAEGGILINLAFLPRGQIVGTDNDSFIDLEKEDILKSTTGVSLTLGVGVSYQLSNDFSVWVSPRFRHALTSMTKETYQLEQSFTRGGLQIGIRKRL